jgi:hypothetical protein
MAPALVSGLCPRLVSELQDMVALLGTKDGVEGMMSFVERRPASFVGA